MTARETASTLAEMTGGFDLRRDAIAAALADAYRRGEESMLERAASVADRHSSHYPEVIGNTDERITHRHCAMGIAAAIRALHPRSPNEQETER